MIPKIIHYIWLGKTQIPAEQQKWVDGWKQLMPDYQYMLWNDESVSGIDIPYIKEAIQNDKYAFASDVVRLWALYKFGGVYLDTDVEVVKPLDSLLNYKAFIGRESCMQINYRTTSFHLSSYCLGAEPNNAFISKCMNYYRQRHFVCSDDVKLPAKLKFDMRNASEIYSNIAELFGYNPSALAPLEQVCENDLLHIMQPNAFSSNSKKTATYCIHHSAGSWRDGTSPIINYSLWYKFKWRICLVIKKAFNHFGYLLIKIN